MDLVNIVYRYVNRFINSEELICLLEDLDKTKFLKKETKEIDRLINNAKEIIKTIPNEIDEIEKKRIANIEHMISLIEPNLDNSSLDEKGKEQIDRTYNNLLKDKEKIKDGGKRYQKLFDLLSNNDVYINYCKKMNDLELLEFITQYISAPLFPPMINQEDFDDLVRVGIKEDKRESLWRLAMNYHRRNKDFSKIADYFIEKRDNYYLAELICGVEEDLNLDEIINKALATDDMDFIKKMAHTSYLESIFSEKQKEKVKKFLIKKEE